MARETQATIRKFVESVAREVFGEAGRVVLHRSKRLLEPYRWHCCIHHLDDEPHNVYHRTLREIRIYFNGLQEGIHKAQYAARKKEVARG